LTAFPWQDSLDVRIVVVSSHDDHTISALHSESKWQHAQKILLNGPAAVPVISRAVSGIRGGTSDSEFCVSGCPITTELLATCKTAAVASCGVVYNGSMSGGSAGPHMHGMISRGRIDTGASMTINETRPQSEASGKSCSNPGPEHPHTSQL
jgi:hypothetical protein